MTTPHQLINNVLEVNGSWREAFNDFAICFTFDIDAELENTIIADYISEECNIEISEAVDEIRSFIFKENYILTKDQALSNEEYIRDLLDSNGCDSDLFDEWIAEQ